jgi:multicomponent Na+:H+ antiporter subunit F
MMAFATDFAFVLLGAAMAVAVFRVIVGPTLADRILALDVVTTFGLALIAVFAIRTGLFVYADIAIALALVGFLATAAFARYLLSRGRK